EKYSSHPDLQDLPHHSPPRATHHLRPHSSAAATIHATATTSAVTPPPLPTPHHAISTPWQPPSPLSPSTAGCLHHISTTNTTATSLPPPSPRHPQPPVQANSRASHVSRANGKRGAYRLFGSSKRDVERPEEDSPDTLMEVERELSEPWILFMNESSCTDGSKAGLILTNPEGMEFIYALRLGSFDIKKYAEKMKEDDAKRFALDKGDICSERNNTHKTVTVKGFK
nr:reverse transcriptase domain-containing protein [Tanacetum cinerariifolium]